jgi:hypothetical protein
VWNRLRVFRIRYPSSPRRPRPSSTASAASSRPIRSLSLCRVPVCCVPSRTASTCRKRPFFRHLYIKTIILPRQARDKHRENSKKDAVFRTCRTQTNALISFATVPDVCPEPVWVKKIVLSIKIAFKGVLRTGPDARLRKKLSSFRFPETRAVRGLAGVPGGGRGWCCSVTVRERPAQKRVDLFCSTFPMFVPSLSWQNDDF